MRPGSITTRGGQPYKPYTMRGYEHSLELGPNADPLTGMTVTTADE